MKRVVKRTKGTARAKTIVAARGTNTKTFLTEDFLLHTDVARELYHDHAKHEPIFD